MPTEIQPMPGLWAATDYIRVAVTGIETEARVGVHPWEQHPERPNRLVVDVEMFARLPQGKTAGIVIDYDPVRDFIKSWASRPHTPYLETLVEEVVAECFKLPRVEACRVGVFKPDIFNEARRAGIEVYRLRPGA